MPPKKRGPQARTLATNATGAGASTSGGDGLWAQPTGTSAAFTIAQHDPPRLLNFGSGGNPSRVGSGNYTQSQAAPSINMPAPHITGGTFASGSHPQPPSSHRTGGSYNTTPINVSEELRVMQSSPSMMMPNTTSIHLTGMSSNGLVPNGSAKAASIAPLPTGVTSFSVHTVPASASAMAGATSVYGDRPPSIARNPTGASVTAMSVPTQLTGPSVPGAFRTSSAPHNTGAGSSFNFQNLPPPKNAFGEDVDRPESVGGSVAEEGNDGAGADFVGAPTRVGDANSSSSRAEPTPTGGTHAPLAWSPTGTSGLGSDASGPISVGSRIDKPMSQTMKYASEMPMKRLLSSAPKGKTIADATIAESRGMALIDATRAFFGNHRPASQRFIWSLPADHDSRVASLMEWISYMQWALAKHGMRKFFESRKRGALMVNAGYISPYHRNEPVFDWLTFDRAQQTGDRILQESIATYDPATTTLIFIFLISESYSSAAIWRRQVTLPPSTQLAMSMQIETLKNELRKTTNVIHIKSPALWNGRPTSTTSSSVSTPKPIVQKEIIRERVEVVEKEPAPVVLVEEKKRKKARWWQFWKKIKITWGDG